MFLEHTCVSWVHEKCSRVAITSILLNISSTDELIPGEIERKTLLTHDISCAEI